MRAYPAAASSRLWRSLHTSFIKQQSPRSQVHVWPPSFHFKLLLPAFLYRVRPSSLNRVCKALSFQRPGRLPILSSCSPLHVLFFPKEMVPGPLLSVHLDLCFALWVFVQSKFPFSTYNPFHHFSHLHTAIVLKCNVPLPAPIRTHSTPMTLQVHLLSLTPSYLAVASFTLLHLLMLEELLEVETTWGQGSLWGL